MKKHDQSSPYTVKFLLINVGQVSFSVSNAVIFCIILS